MDTSVGKRHLEPLLIPNDDGTGDKRGRRYIYDESPTSHGASAPAGATASAINSVSPQSLSPQTNNSASNTGYVEGEESTEEPKISFMNFKVGCIALFVPMDAGKKTWMAFHHEKPNHFLDPVCILSSQVFIHHSPYC